MICWDMPNADDSYRKNIKLLKGISRNKNYMTNQEIIFVPMAYLAQIRGAANEFSAEVMR